jgi:MoaA/NifB/PqqE/SkfB family radical SAM enzyme
MCGIWSEKPKKILDLATFEKLFEQDATRSLGVVALTGGEPFLLPNFFDYYATARRHRPRAHINISTNGYYTDRTLAFLERTGQKRLSVTISYDGVRSHDSVRGVEGSQDKLLATATEIRKQYPRVPVSLKLTVTRENSGEILDTAHQCKDLGIAFRFKTLEKLNNCHQSRSPSEIDGPDYDHAVIESIATQARAVLELGVETNRDYIRDLLRLHGGAPVGCSCSPRTLFVGFDGPVFLCRKKEPIGNVLESPLDEIWASERKQAIVREMRECHGSTESLGFRHA